MRAFFSTHEPNHAFRYATRALAMKGGSLLGDGAPGNVLTEPLLSALYGVEVAVRRVKVGTQEYAVSIPSRKPADPSAQ